VKNGSEQCDDGNTTTEACAYGTPTCQVCGSGCTTVSSTGPYCGDGVKNGSEECDTSGASETCTAGCKLQKYCIVEYSMTGTFKLTGAAAGNADYTGQTGGDVRLRVPDSNGAPGDGPAAVLYYKMPTKFTVNSLATVTTDIVTTAGTPTNLCPLASATLTGTNMTFPSCPYGTGHCTNNWTPDGQVPPAITPSAGCLKVTATGTIMCSGSCSLAGLSTGTTPVNDTWYQPNNTATFNTGFTTSHNGSTGQTTTCPLTGADADYFEVPERASARSWVKTDGTQVSITCGQLPQSGCAKLPL
jgi:hypothetical protein